jgi:hypothetical protein
MVDHLASRVHCTRCKQDVCDRDAEVDQFVSWSKQVLFVLNECTKDNEEIKRHEEHHGKRQRSELDSPDPNGTMV